MQISIFGSQHLIYLYESLGYDDAYTRLGILINLVNFEVDLFIVLIAHNKVNEKVPLFQSIIATALSLNAIYLSFHSFVKSNMPKGISSRNDANRWWLSFFWLQISFVIR